jgi:transposase
MARQRPHSVEFKRRVAQGFLAGKNLYALSKRHDISRQLMRVRVERYEAGALDEDAQAAEAARVHHAACRRSGMAARRACTAGNPSYRVSK